MAQIRSVVLIVALFAVTGAHWAMLQSFAWATMLTRNLRRDSFSEAVIRTFDGKHPCRMCQAATTGKNTTKKAEFTGANSRFEFLTVAHGVIERVPELATFVSVANKFAAARTLQPPTPPPRALCA